MTRWRRLGFGLGVVVALVLGVVAVALAAPSDPVTSWGTGGHVVVSAAPGSNSSAATAAVVQPDGKVVVVGDAYQEPSRKDLAIFIVRLGPTGNLDPSFGQNGSGITTTSIDQGGTTGDDRATSVALDQSGRIIVGGSTDNSAAVLRYTPTGALDPSFNPGGTQPGVKTFSFASAFISVVNGVAVQPDGEIVAAGQGSAPGGFGAARINPNGSFDTTFGAAHTGVVLTPVDSTAMSPNDGATALVLQPGDGKIVLGGSQNAQSTSAAFALMRYNPDGTLDGGFGTGGIVKTTPPAGFWVDGFALARDPSGRLIIAGDQSNGSVQHFAVQRFNGNGTPDPTFNGGNLLVTPVGSFDGIFGIDVRPDARVVAVGYAFQSNQPGASRFAVASFNDNGTPDTTFNGTGWRIYPSISGNNDAARGMAFAPSAGGGLNLIAVGATTNPSATQDQAAVTELHLIDAVSLQDCDDFAFTANEIKPIQLDPYQRGFGDKGQKPRPMVSIKNTSSAFCASAVAIFHVRGDGVLSEDNSPFHSFHGLLVPGENKTERVGLLVRDPRKLVPGSTHTVDIFLADVDFNGFEQSPETAGSQVLKLVAVDAAAETEKLEVRDGHGNVIGESPDAISASASPRLLASNLVGFSGTASPGSKTAPNPIKRIEVSVLRATPKTKSGAIKDCLWLTSAGGKFTHRKPDNGGCDRPVWLAAKMTFKPHKQLVFSFKLTHPLPAGSYSSSVRGTLKNGVTNTTFPPGIAERSFVLVCAAHHHC